MCRISIPVYAQILLNVNERCIADVVIEAFQDVIENAFSARVLEVIRLLHLVLVVFIEDVRMKDQEGEGDKVGLVWRGVDAGVALVVAVSKSLEAPVDLLCFFGQLRLHEQFTDCHVHWVSKEAEAAHVASKDSSRKGICALGQAGSNDTSAHDFLDAGQVFCWRLVLLSFRENNNFPRDLQRIALGRDRSRGNRRHGTLAGELRVLAQASQAQHIAKALSAGRR
jgi:hypothetical protein